MATGYHLLQQDALPLHFWQRRGEDEETIERLDVLADSFKQHSVCWLVWDRQQEALYEERDLYRCQVVAATPQDILDRAIPFGDLHSHPTALPIFFSAECMRKILAARPVPRQVEPALRPVIKARAFLSSIPGDDPGDDPVSTLEIVVPFAAFRTITNRARYGAARQGKRVVQLQRHLLFLKAAILALDQQAEQERDALRRQELFFQKERLHQMQAIRSEWQGQQKKYVSIEQRPQDDGYIVCIGLHPSLYQDAA